MGPLCSHRITADHLWALSRAGWARSSRWTSHGSHIAQSGPDSQSPPHPPHRLGEGEALPCTEQPRPTAALIRTSPAKGQALPHSAQTEAPSTRHVLGGCRKGLAVCSGIAAVPPTECLGPGSGGTGTCGANPRTSDLSTQGGQGLTPHLRSQCQDPEATNHIPSAVWEVPQEGRDLKKREQ